MSQIQNKFIANNAVTTTKINNDAVTNAKVATGIDAAKLGDGSVSNTEFQRLNGITSDIQTQLDAKVDESREGVANGIATLDGGGKVPVSQLPSAVMTYEGVYNATTNSPTLIDGTGDTGMVYRVGTAGTQNFGSGNITFNVGDYVIYNGTIWEKSDTTDAVASVNGFTGVVTLDTDDIAEGTALYFTDERAQDAVGAALTDTASVDLTYNDGANTITAVVLPAGVDHDSLQNFVANKHIDHSAVNIATPANGGLSGGGNITASRNIILDVNNLTTITPDSADLLPIYDVSGTVTGKATVTNVIGTSAANRTLSNLTSPTAINQELYFDLGQAGFLKTKDDTSATQFLYLATGDSSTAGSGTIEVFTGGGATNFPSGDINIYTGEAFGTGNSGNVGLTTGTVGGGTRGSIALKDGSEGTAGHVWTSTDISGNGSWQAASVVNRSKETFTLVSGDITGQLVTLANAPLANSVHLIVKGGAPTLQGASHDYTVSGSTIVFQNDLATGGSAALVIGDILQVVYEY